MLKKFLEVLKCYFLGVETFKSIQAVSVEPGILRLFRTQEPFLSRTFGTDLRRIDFWPVVSCEFFFGCNRLLISVTRERVDCNGYILKDEGHEIGGRDSRFE